MAYDEELAGRVRELLAAERAEERRMFGGLAFLVGGAMAVAVVGRGGLMVRVAREQTAALLDLAGVDEVDMGRGPVRGWVEVRPEALDGAAALQEWVQRGLEQARTSR